MKSDIHCMRSGELKLGFVKNLPSTNYSKYLDKSNNPKWLQWVNRNLCIIIDLLPTNYNNYIAG